MCFIPIRGSLSLNRTSHRTWNTIINVCDSNLDKKLYIHIHLLKFEMYWGKCFTLRKVFFSSVLFAVDSIHWTIVAFVLSGSTNCTERLLESAAASGIAVGGFLALAAVFIAASSLWVCISFLWRACSSARRAGEGFGGALMTERRLQVFKRRFLGRELLDINWVCFTWIAPVT